MLKKLLSGVKEKYQKAQEESSLYLRLLNSTGTVTNLVAVPIINKKGILISYKDILNICPDLNDDKAALIRGVLPAWEDYLIVMYAKECKSNLEYFLVPTTECFWIISTKGYTRFKYDGLRCAVVKNNLMSKVLNVGNILFEVNGSNEIISKFLMILNDDKYRTEFISSKKKIWCGITPILRYINDIGTGISTDSNSNIVFHTRDFNYLYNIKDINNYELLLDDNVILERGSNRRVRLTANKNSCSEMNIRVTTADKAFIMPIIEKSTFGEVYQATSSKYMEARTFADKVINVLDDLDEKRLNGG